jgi:hypothetical protein
LLRLLFTFAHRLNRAGLFLPNHPYILCGEGCFGFLGGGGEGFVKFFCCFLLGFSLSFLMVFLGVKGAFFWRQIFSVTKPS